MNSTQEDADARTVHEMEQRLAKKEARREWRYWIIALVAILLGCGVLVLGKSLLTVFLMRGFN